MSESPVNSSPVEDVRPTSEMVVVDTDVQYRRHRVRLIHEVTSQLDVPTLPTPTSSHLLCFHFVCCEEKVRDLINLPVDPRLNMNRIHKHTHTHMNIYINSCL
jgi:hypothetical protein